MKSDRMLYIIYADIYAYNANIESLIKKNR